MGILEKSIERFVQTMGNQAVTPQEESQMNETDRVNAGTRFIKQCVSRYGHPRVIITDNGAEFINEVFRHGCSSFQIEHQNTTPAHPQSNGAAEMFHRTLKETLRKLMKHLILGETVGCCYVGL